MVAVEAGVPFKGTQHCTSTVCLTKLVMGKHFALIEEEEVREEVREEVKKH